MTSPLFNALQKDDDKFLCKTYTRYPVAVEKGCGSRLWDINGKEYIDLLSGIAVTALGHANEEIADAIAVQAKKLIHVSNLFYQQEQITLAKSLLKTTHFDKAFFCNSGAEANEAAIKLARRYHQRIKNTEAYEIITFDGCFHGRTLATVAATGQKKFQDGFSPMPDGFKNIPYGDLALVEQSITPKTAGVLIEFIQGEGGVRVAPRDFLDGIAQLCKANDVLFIMDEVQAGMGRTGKWWGFQNYELTPDIITCAKSLANGLPMGAMLATNEVARSFVAGSHATTFGGGALVSTVATKVLEIIERDNLLDNAASCGTWALERFRSIQNKIPGAIREVRGMGLMIGIELLFPGKEVWEALIEQGFIVNLTQEKVLRLLPALTITKDDLEAFAQALENILAK